MALKDYYLILGVPRSEPVSGIRTAYREMVKRYHPDVAGPSGAPRFRDIVEAYGVLSDCARRRDYNDKLGEEPPSPRAGAVQREAEPLMSQTHSIFDCPESIRPSFDELLDRYARNLTGVGIPKAEREQGLNIEVVLSPEEALRGGELPVTMSVFRTCPVCQGAGEVWLFPCLGCDARGMVELHETVRVRIPPRVRPGTVFEFPLRGLDVHNFYLRVHILVGD